MLYLDTGRSTEIFLIFQNIYRNILISISVETKYKGAAY